MLGPRKPLLLWHTIKHLKSIQITNRVQRRFVTVKPLSANEGVNVRPQSGKWAVGVSRAQSILENDTFCFLNETMRLQKASDWNNPNIPKLWLYNLHYHDGLLCAETHDLLKRRYLNRWIAENPFGAGNGWEPYPASLRIINWIKWLLAGNKRVDGMTLSLFQQVHALFRSVEYHLLGNHLFANAKALVFGGLFFDGEHAARWFAKGLEILKQQVPEQFLADGGHFELSTTYHATLSEDLLDLINILRVYGQTDEAERLVPVASKALEWLSVMTRPDGLPPLFNDAAYAISPTLVDLRDYASRLGLPDTSVTLDGLSQLHDSGYFRYTAPQYNIWCDAGQIGPDYIPGHAHCDMMNFELFANGKPIIVDPGISTYEVCEQRLLERATKSHNTVQFAELEQSEIWAAFRVARRAKLVDRQVSAQNVSATMVNYNHVYQHRRKFSYSETSVLIEDEVVAKKAATSTARFHFHPDVRLELNGRKIVADGLELSFRGASSVDLTSYHYAPEFNKTLPAQCIEVVFDGDLETNIML